MCQMDCEYFTVVGPGNVLQEVAAGWERFATPGRYGVYAVKLRRLGDYYEGFSPDCPGVLIAYTREPVGGIAADMLQAELAALPVVCEPGYQFQAASIGPGSSSGGAEPTAVFDQQNINVVLNNLGVGAAGKVAVLDSGAPSGLGQMIDFLGAAPLDKTAADPFGHATAVIGLIRELRPNADVIPVRVLDDKGLADSFAVFLALAFCLWDSPHRPDIVNASLTTLAAPPCASSLGGSLAYVADLCAAAGAGGNKPLPPLVTAAGNAPNPRVQYPALLPHATVVKATDFSGADAPYNITNFSGVTGTIAYAYGGTKADPFGTLTDAAGNTKDIFGTSYAAAVHTASLLSA
ncbi:S8/S53 family peptidase [Streptomyces sp. NPDC096339]|uniref:S8/S53 family peptidase n=1 Tax=Streptomyces sp. NPDC096339 TaxID=3366086 RepID=UPI0037F23EC0